MKNSTSVRLSPGSPLWPEQSSEASSVELSLFEEERELWSQNILFGEPPDNSSQSMLFGDVAENLSASLQKFPEEKTSSLLHPLYFAGVSLGVLRVAYASPRIISRSEREVVQLLAEQASVILIDSRFTEEILRIRRINEQSLQAKTGFLANLSHEIRGPLGIIMNGIELTLSGVCGELNPQVEESLRLVERSGEHLLSLVNDVLDFAKVQAGHTEPAAVSLQVKALLEDLTTVVRSQAHSKNLSPSAFNRGRGSWNSSSISDTPDR